MVVFLADVATLDGSSSNDNPAGKLLTAAIWGQRVFLTSLQDQYQQHQGHNDGAGIVGVGGANNDDGDYVFSDWVDNASSRCAAQYEELCAASTADGPFMVGLRWARILILKVGRMYMGAPLCLMLLPLLVGMAVGYHLGAQRSRQTESVQHQQDKGSSTPTTTTTTTTTTTIIPMASKMGMETAMRTDTSSASISSIVSIFTVWFWMSVNRVWQLLPFSVRRMVLSLSTPVSNTPATVPRAQTKPSNTTTTTTSTVPSAARGEGEESTKTLLEKEDRVRTTLLSDDHTTRESGVELAALPRHVAVVMDGNRRYGRERYGDATKGHWDGSKTLVEFAKWCIAEHISVLTVYAFSSENWNRDPKEVAALMAIFCTYCDELRVEAKKRNIRIHVLSTETQQVRLPFVVVGGSGQ